MEESGQSELFIELLRSAGYQRCNNNLLNDSGHEAAVVVFLYLETR
jgi:hypothetical protein